MPVDPQLAQLLAFLAAAGTKPMWESTPAEARHGFRALAVDLRDPAALPEVASVEDITVPGGEGERPARVYRPEADEPDTDGAGSDVPLPTVVLFHGGGFVIGDLDTHDLLARTIARDCAAVVVSVDYRLAPEQPFPAAADDAEAAARWAHEHLAELGGGDRLAVAGDSAGANLAAVVAQTFRDEGIALAGQLLLYPATDMASVDAVDYPSRASNGEGYFLDAPTMGWFLQQYAGHLDHDALVDPRVSPARGSLSGLAPAVVATAEFDPLRDEGVAYADALAAAGVPVTATTYDGMIHGFADMGRHSEAAQAAVAETCAAFRSVLHG